MTVKELIEHLQKCDPGTHVVLECCDRADCHVSNIFSIRTPKEGSEKEVWLCGHDGFYPQHRESVGFNILFEETQ